MTNLIKSIIGLILYVPAVIIGLLIAVFKIAKEEGILDDMKPMSATDGLAEGIRTAKEFNAEIKKMSA